MQLCTPSTLHIGTHHGGLRTHTLFLFYYVNIPSENHKEKLKSNVSFLFSLGFYSVSVLFLFCFYSVSILFLFCVYSVFILCFCVGIFGNAIAAELDNFLTGILALLCAYQARGEALRLNF